ncbi:hypothetical protein M3J09_008270 [Ascochyta lentis]
MKPGRSTSATRMSSKTTRGKSPGMLNKIKPGNFQRTDWLNCHSRSFRCGNQGGGEDHPAGKKNMCTLDLAAMRHGRDAAPSATWPG